MKTIILGTIILLLSLNFATADVFVTEIMHSPEGISDSDGEWVELYNSGREEVNLSDWTINEKEFDGYVLGPNEYLVIARELVDGDDADNESFESFFGHIVNSVDGTLSLTTSGVVNLSNGEVVSYDGSLGLNGKSMQRVSLDQWVEAEVTPGYGNFSVVSVENNEVVIYYEVLNSAPSIVNVSFSIDESSADGVQIMPNVELDKEFEIEVLVNDSNGLEDIEEVVGVMENKSFNFSFVDGKYVTTIVMKSKDLAKVYSLNISVSDGSDKISEVVEFEYLGIISTKLNTSSVYFSTEPGEVSEFSVVLVNTGNVVVDTEVEGSVDIGSLEVYNQEWLTLASPVTLNLGLMPNGVEEILFRLSLPYSVESGQYQGKVVINSKEVGE
ncbi:MAG: lamin tail domain-containing protein [Nanoarchaeota archaeon]|nr:lamin tail domain-containing protein [Nanoarchaeota archaeon]